MVIPVHDARREIGRAVNSVLDHNSAAVRVTVVCHNIDAEKIRSRLSGSLRDPRLRFLSLADGIRSPSGPFNLGLDHATGAFTSVMGSDDELEPGAVDSWLALARRDGAAVVIPRLRHAGGLAVPTPPVRPLRRSRLDGVRDRLSYRSAPLGLVSTQVFGADRFPTNLGSGEDVAYVTGLWFSNQRISFDRTGPAYLIHADAPERVTIVPKPVAADMAFLRDLLEDTRFQRLGRPQRDSVVVKLLRVHIFGAVANRPDSGQWTREDREQLAEMTSTCLTLAPTARRVLSRTDDALVAAIQDVESPVAELLALSRLRRRLVHPNRLLPSDVRAVFAVEAPLRQMVASAIVRGLR